MISIQDKIRIIIAKCCEEYHVNFEEGSVSGILDDALSAITKIIEEEKTGMKIMNKEPLNDPQN